MNKQFWRLVFAMVWLVVPVQALAETKLPRTILGIYDNVKEGDPRFTQIHKILEMPLNHLGFKVDYRDSSKEEWPEITDDVHAVVVWLHPDSKIKDAPKWLKWLGHVLDKKKKLIILGELCVSDPFRESKDGMRQVNEVLNRIGVQDNNHWISVTYDASILYRDTALVDFERQYGGSFMPYMSTSTYGNKSVSHLKMRSSQYNGVTSDLVITHPEGAYVAPGYLHYEQVNAKEEIVYKQWYVNPFKFLHDVLQDDEMPKPDVTTLNGRRIFYSHQDGDGWNNLTELEEYAGKKIISGEVILEKIIKPFPQIPFTVGLTISEMLKDCYGVPNSQVVAKKVLAMNNVEPASHTYSHPLYWGFFADSNPDKEKPYLSKYPSPPYQQFFVSKWIAELTGFGGEEVKPKNATPAPKAHSTGDPMVGIRTPYVKEEEILRDYGTPRSFACEPFDLKKEVKGSIDFINRLAYPKKVKLYQWSGDTKPFKEALREVRQSGVYNINGGGSRFDVEYPSYTSISSIGTAIDGERQIYSSNTNENDYTDFWTDRFFGFKYLQTTVDNTETPVRVHPFNIYFHSYSGQKQASLNALRENVIYAATLPLAPIFASEYAAIAESFYGTDIIQLAPRKWKILNRHHLQTIRFDHATLLAVDINNSKGVLGQKYTQGSLYIALDPDVNNPVISLKNKENLGGYESAQKSYLIESNWKINGLKFIKNKLIFQAMGLGKADMTWMQPSKGSFVLKVRKNRKTVYKDILTTTPEGLLHLSFPGDNTPLTVTITPNDNV